MATIKFPSEMPSAADVGGNDKLMISKDGSGEAFQVTFSNVKQYLDITDIELYPVQGGATEPEATVIPNGPSGQNRKMDASPGWYSVGGVPVEATSGHVWKWFWNGTSWSLVDMGELPQVEIKILEYIPGQTYTTGQQIRHNGEWWEVSSNISSTTQEPVAGGDWKPAIRSVSDSPEYTIGKNKIDVSTSERSVLINSSGDVVPSTADWSTSDFIDISDASSISITRGRTIAQYDASGVFIPGTYVDNTTAAPPLSFTKNPSASFLKVTYQYSRSDQVQVEFGESPTSYEPFSLSVYRRNGGSVLTKFDPIINDEVVTSITTNQKFVDVIESSSGVFKIENDSAQLFDKNNVTIGAISSNGGISGDLPWRTSDFIRVGSNTPAFVSHSRYIAQYDADNVFIPGSRLENPTNGQENSTLFTTEPNCEFIRVSLNEQYLNSLMVAISAEPVPYEEYRVVMAVKETKEGQELFFNPLISDDFIQQVIDRIGLNPTTDMKDLKEIKIEDYPLHFETEDFKAYLSKETYGIEAVHGDVAVRKLSPTSFSISTDGIDGEYGAPIVLNSTNFPNLIAGSQIMKIIIVGWARNSTPESPLNLNDWRCNIFTNKGQIYHNKPNRTPDTGTPDGVYQSGDELRWDESVVWDLPERRLPSKTSDAFPYMLNPALPDSAYAIYPAPNSDNGYGHGGFGVSESYGDKTFPRFYMHNRDNIQCNPFFWMGGYAYNNKSTIIGTYRSNTAVASRICAFLTTDGGRSYFNKYEFENRAARGNVLNGSLVSGSYTAASFTLRKRTLNFPSEANKEPAEKFIFGSEIVISSISKDPEMVITTAEAHGLVTNDTIQIKDNPSSTDNSAGYDFLRNDSADVDSGGNGKFWRVEVLTSTTFKVYEMVHNPHTNITARHIHSINRCKDGYMIVTGETYPTGQHIYMKTPSPERFDVKFFAYMDYEFVRLTSSENAIQRSLGTVILDDADQTVIFASDDGTISRDPESLPEGRTDTLTRSSIGIFRGKLADVDDLSKFECIYEANEVAYAFRTTNDGLWVFAGQQGDVAVSVDKGSTFRSFKGQQGYPQQYPKGEDSKGRLVLDRMIIYRK